MVLVQYAIPSAHSSNPAYLGPRSTLESPEPETSEGQYSIRQPGVGAPKDWSDLPDDDGLDYGLEGDNVWEDDRARTVSFLMSTRGFTREQALAMCDQNDRENGIVHDDGTPRQATAVQMPDELMLSEGEDSEDDGEVDDEEEEVEEVNFVDEMPGRTDEERAALNQEMGDLEDCVKGLADDYLLVDRLGEGTFSSVYKAIDLKNTEYNNTLWLNAPAEEDEDDDGAGPSRRRKAAPKVYVAIKRIYVTSSPARIENEISILEDLRGCINISQVITAFRYEDQILVVMPFHCNDDFRNYYRHLSITSLRSYFRELFRALRATHARGILHRDVKPANFLFDELDGSGILVDFGLAQRYTPPPQHAAKCQHSPASFDHPHGKREQTRHTRTVEQAVYDARKRGKLPAERIGFPLDDKRPSVKANRAGTRGFRAPEVLLKCPDQSVAIDIWSAGIILLSILTRKFPIFNSNDDTEALMEISAIFGKQKMDKCASIHNRTFLSNVPALDHQGHTLESIIMTANPYLWTNHSPDDTLEQHRQGITEALDLLKHVLALDPCKRYTAGQALEHEFLAEKGVDMDADGPRGPGDAVCGEGHRVKGDGSHWVIVDGEEHEVGYGEGIAFGEEPCPIHAVRDWRRPGTFCDPSIFL